MDFNHAKDAQRQRRYYIVATALIGGVFVALWFAVIVAFVESPADTDQSSPTPSSVSLPGEADVQACDGANRQTPQCQLRREALSIWSDIDDAIIQLNAIHVSAWAPDQFSRSEAEFSKATSLFNRGEYEKALEFLKVVLEDLQSLTTESELALERSLEDGWDALSAENATQAMNAFGLALLIDPNNKSAMKGAARAAALEEVLFLYDIGMEERRAGRVDTALAKFESASKLDPENEKVLSALRALQPQISNRNHRRAITAGLTALDGRDGEAAKRAFETALKLKPGSAEARTGLERAEKLLTSQNITILLARASQAASAEDWEASLILYSQVLGVDPSVDEAIEGKAAVSALIETETEIQNLLSASHRLSSAAVFNHARDVLIGAESMATSRPRLKKGVDKLASLMRDMQQPTEVVFQSDGNTSISILRHGSLGVLDERLIKLLPGQYTVVGTRKGYRDVRLEIEISPFDEQQNITVICHERF